MNLKLLATIFLVLTVTTFRLNAQNQWIGKGQVVNVDNPFGVSYDEISSADDAIDDVAVDETSRKKGLDKIAQNVANNFYDSFLSNFGK